MSLAVYERPPTYNSSVPSVPQAAALKCLRELQDYLSQSSDDCSILIEHTVQLISAVKNSHMEAIRFQLFGLRRHLSSDSTFATKQAIKLLEEIRVLLKTAGFRT